MTKAVPGYRAAHTRVQRARGKASEFDCYCGCGRPAQEWALMTDIELYWEAKPETGMIRPYSLDVFAYEALTIRCHRAYDENPPPRRVPGSNLMKEPTG